MKKLSNEEFIEKCRSVHGDVYDYSLVEYNGNREKIDIICPVHGVFRQLAKNHLNGQGCPECGKDKISKIKKKTFEEFSLQIHEKYGSQYTLFEEEYSISSEKMHVRCNKCGKILFIRPNDLLIYGHVCVNERDIKRYSKEDIIKSFREVHGDRYEYIFDEGKEYLKKDKIKIICPKHGSFEQEIGAHESGRGCPECGIERFRAARKIPISKVKKRLEELCLEKFSFDLTNYKGTQEPLPFKCNKCGNEFSRSYSNFINNPTCPHCNKEKDSIEKRKTTEEFIKESKFIFGKNAFDYSKTIYTKSSEKVTLICKECGREFEIEANSHLQGHGCPYHFMNRSRKEDELYKWFIENIDKEAVSNYRVPGKGIEIDIFSEKYQFGIEFDGIFWHNELNKDKDYHLRKLNLCKENGIRLFHLFEDEWDERPNVVKSMLLNICGKSPKRIYARKCIVKEIDSHVSMKFLNENHLQGGCGASIRLGLFFNNELVSVMTFGRSRHFVGSGKTEYELLRFANKQEFLIIGGASKLFQYFIREYNPNEIVSYADKRWSIGNLYNKLGFTLYNESKPSYYYVKDNKRVYRFNLRKEVLIKKYGCPKEMTEREFCKSMKWWRIYDCGCLCFIWKKEK